MLSSSLNPPAVGQAGQRIVAGKFVRAPLRLLAAADLELHLARAPEQQDDRAQRREEEDRNDLVELPILVLEDVPGKMVERVEADEEIAANQRQGRRDQRLRR